jgi:hypothetical protein
MSATDQQKLIKAGFVIIRKDEQNLRIKFKGNGSHEWATFEKGFASKAALQRRVNELLILSTFVED